MKKSNKKSPSTPLKRQGRLLRLLGIVKTTSVVNRPHKNSGTITFKELTQWEKRRRAVRKLRLHVFLDKNKMEFALRWYDKELTRYLGVLKKWDQTWARVGDKGYSLLELMRNALARHDQICLETCNEYDKLDRGPSNETVEEHIRATKGIFGIVMLRTPQIDEAITRARQAVDFIPCAWRSSREERRQRLMQAFDEFITTFEELSAENTLCLDVERMNRLLNEYERKGIDSEWLEQIKFWTGEGAGT